MIDEELRSPSEEVRLVRYGRDIVRQSEFPGGEAGLFQGDRLVAIGRRTGEGWHPVLVLPDDDRAAP